VERFYRLLNLLVEDIESFSLSSLELYELGPMKSCECFTEVERECSRRCVHRQICKVESRFSFLKVSTLR
jgi:hypothetical protein